MYGGCMKCSGEGRVIVHDEGDHWHWEACSDCNSFEEMALAVETNKFWHYASDDAINDDLFMLEL